MTITDDQQTIDPDHDSDFSIVLDQDAVVDLQCQSARALIRALLAPARAKSGRPTPPDGLSARARRFALLRIHAEMTDRELRTLANGDPDLDVRAGAISVLGGRRAELDQATLRRLVADPSYKVRLELLRIDDLPSWAIVRLALDSDPLVRATATEHSHATTDMLLSVLRAADTAEQAAAVCRSQKLDLAAILPSLHVENDAVREAVALALLSRSHLPRTLLADCLDQRHSELVRATTVLHPELPLDLMTAQAASPSARVRRAVAANRATDAGTLERLHDDPAVTVRTAVAEHPSTRPETLAAMAHDESPSVRTQVIRNPHRPAATLFEAASDPDVEVRRAVLAQDDLDGKTLRVLAQDEDVDIRLGALQHRRCPADAFVTATSDPEVCIRRAIALLQRCPAKALRHLVVDEDIVVRRRAARHHSTPAPWLDHAARRDRDLVVQRAAVRNPSCSEFTLAWARTQHHLLLPALSNPVPADQLFPMLTAIEQQHRLQADQVRELRRAVSAPTRPFRQAQRREVTERARQVRSKLLEQLRDQPYAWLRQFRAFSVLSDIELSYVIGTHLRPIASEPNKRIRRLALEHPAITGRELHAFVADEVNDHRLLVARHALTQRNTLERLVDDTSAAVREAVALHKRADRSILVRLATDPDADVRAAASRRLLESL